ncbi:MAG: hypothetical protein ABSC03_05700 [Verrucomicrobiota bacterium]|jgi:hypothetical protein
MPRRAIVTAVFGKHVDLLPRTLGSFTRCVGYELHAFVFGDTRPQNPDPRITYHTVPWGGGFGPQYREVNYRRWEVIAEFDFAVVVDGGDTFCVRALPPAEELLRGSVAGAVVEHLGSRRLGPSYTSTYFNAGVTFWDVAASRPLRQQILERGRTRFRADIDDQLTLNEVLHRHILQVRILPSLFNFHLHLWRRKRGWPTLSNLTGVFVVHTDDIDRIEEFLPAGEEVYPLEELPAETAEPGAFARLRRRLRFRWRHKC